jgi:ATP-dependent DNA helicase DinG
MAHIFLRIDSHFSQNYICFMPDTLLTIKGILERDGLLAKSLSGFEFRSSQLQMALLLEEALQKKIPAIVEAGTGTGKTFGYLVPVILSGKKAVVSTGTKNLQEQIYNKDLPLLEKATNLDINAMIMKGRKNYLCLYRYHQFFSQPSLLKTGMEKTRKKIEKWLKKTRFADRSEISWLADDDALWDEISSTSDQCLGSKCMFLDDCFLNRLRSKAAKSKIIIVNHHLFFADMKVKKGGFGEIIPRFQVAVFDEAHTIEEIATGYFGEILSTNQFIELVNDLEKETKDLQDTDNGRLEMNLKRITTGSENLRGFFSGQGERGRLDHAALLEIDKGPGREIRKGLKYIQETPGLRELDNAALQALLARTAELDQLLDNILSTRDSNWLNWYEKRKKSLVLHASPLDISERMNETLYQKLQTVVFTSATLSTNKNFNYIRSRLGLPDATLEGIYPSHFDFENQTLMYLPRDLPNPNASDFASKVAIRITEILKKTDGRALVLFTSHHNLNLVFQILEGNIPYTMFRQGDAPRSILLDEFRRDIHSVLLATASFWQGIDVPGESLSCLIIDKLPFEPPNDPVVAARIDAIRDRGGNPFTEYQVPSAIISLKQGLGRLIRNNSDRGVLSVLDVRVLTSRYGRFFLESLPKMPISHDIDDITRFFEQ